MEDDVRKHLGSLLILSSEALLGLVAGIVGNVAANQLPPWVKAHGLGLFGIFAVLIVIGAIGRYCWEQRVSSTANQILSPRQLVTTISQPAMVVTLVAPDHSDLLVQQTSPSALTSPYEALSLLLQPTQQEVPCDRHALVAPDHLIGREAYLEWLLGCFDLSPAADTSDVPDAPAVGRRSSIGKRAPLYPVVSPTLAALQGMGGIGKTALAAEAIQRLLAKGRFSGGLVTVDARNTRNTPQSRNLRATSDQHGLAALCATRPVVEPGRPSLHYGPT